MNSSEDLSWPLVCASAEKINCMFTKKVIDTDSLFDEHILVKNYMSESERRKRRKNTTISLEEKWTQLFQAFIEKSIAILNFLKWSSLYFVAWNISTS